MTNYTDKEYSLAATNLVISIFPQEQVTKVTKIAHVYVESWGKISDEPSEYTTPLTLVSVRTDNKFRKPKTRKVYVHTDRINWDTPQPITIATEGFRAITVDEALQLEVVNNDFSTISKEQGQVNWELQKIADAEAKIEAKKQEAIKKIVGEIEYNCDPNSRYIRSPKQLKTSFKKYSADLLDEAKLQLNPKGLELLNAVIEELALPIIEKNNSKSLLATVTNCEVLKVCEDLEKTFEEESAQLFEDALAHFIKKDLENKKWCADNNRHYYKKSEAQLRYDAQYVVESNKFKLFGCVIRNLGQYPIASVDRDYLESGVNGWEGSWTVTMEDESTKTFHARSIIAEGYHVCRHYRYIGTIRG
jgi:hypothetical protein